MTVTPSGELDCEYVVVGSGAGGGTLAARLAAAGHKVVLLEAGGDPQVASGGASQASGSERSAVDDYDVPAFHAFASENDAMSWRFFVRHYASDAQQKRDEKYLETFDGQRVDGVYYPRAGTLGGCTAHNAMFLVSPRNADWDDIAELTGDPSWGADNMRRYFERVENCRHRPVYRWLRWLGINPTRHGWNGWLDTEKAIPEVALADRRLMSTIKQAIWQAAEELPSLPERIRWFLTGFADPNDWRLIREDAIGLRYAPHSTRSHRRSGTRERLRDVERCHPGRLIIELNALATRVLLDERNRAIGVEYLKGERQYRAHANASTRQGERRQVRASREVILAGGAFNSPQLLMLSGIGPAAQLQRHGIAVRVDLPGVGGNLQDRYEIGVVNRMPFKEWQVLRGARFSAGDPQYRQWASSGDGVYGTNGSLLSVLTRSRPGERRPDLYCFALLGLFKGYFPKYSLLFPQHLNYLTWAILKAYTNNHAGEVRLRSSDPRDPPLVDFHYFEEGSDGWSDDLRAVVEGIKLVRTFTAPLRESGVVEELPGDHVQSDEELAVYVRDNAWGHHASCSCAIGPRSRNGVLDGNFRVHGTQGLRVVDASVFPRIPGFFIVSAVYMIAEKAADVILQDARGSA